MKKQLLFVALVFIAASQAFSQTTLVQNSKTCKVIAKCVTPKVDTRVMFNGSEPLTTPFVAPINATRGTIGTVIGNTFYDLQSNSGMQRRVVNQGNGKVSATFTWSATADEYGGTWADRGTGYNYNNGSGWGALQTSRLETDGIRTGWPALSDINNHELIISHATGGSPAYRLKSTENASVGGSVWNTTYTATPNNSANTYTGGAIWPRVATSGSNIYIVDCSQDTGLKGPNGVKDCIYYSRSTDGGATFVDDHITLPGFDSTRYARGGGDDYFVDANGSTVAIVIGGFGKDVTLWKSTDNGVNFTKTDVFPFALAAWDYNFQTDINADGITDTLDTNDGTVTCLIDDNDVVHVWFGYARVFEDDPNVGAFAPFVGGLAYWNETDPSTVTLITTIGDYDCEGDGFFLGSTYSLAGTTSQDAVYRADGLINFPQAAIGSDGTIYVVYSAVSEDTTDENTLLPGQNYRDIYVIYTQDGGTTWSFPIRHTGEHGFEDVFPSIARTVDSDLYITWQEDDEPGTVLQNADFQSFNGNDIRFLQLDATNEQALGLDPASTCTIPVGITSVDPIVNDISQYPNPTQGAATFSLSLQNAGDVQISIYNMLGQVVKSVNYGSLSSGDHNFDIDLSDLANGVYSYTVKIGNDLSGGKLVINK